MPIYAPIVPKNWPERLTFSPGVRVDNLIFLSGTTATDEQGNIVGAGDIVAQTRQIFRKFSPGKCGRKPRQYRRNHRLRALARRLQEDSPAPSRPVQGTALAGGDRSGSQRPRPKGRAYRDQRHRSALKTPTRPFPQSCALSFSKRVWST